MIKDYILERLFNVRSPSKVWLEMVNEELDATMAVVTYLRSGVGRCVCSKCNKHINKDDHYCRHCGRQITGVKITRG